MKLLLVEDHELLREAVSDQLTMVGFDVSAFESVEEVVEQPLDNWELAVLDVNLPGEKGTVLAQRLRQTHPKIGIVVFTVIKELTEKVSAYEAGADVYLTKPIDPEELVCVLNALAKRLNREKELLNAHSRFQLFIEGRLLTSISGNNVRLSVDEVQLLHALLLAPNKELETWQIMALLHKDHQDKATLEVFISRLRKKLVSLSGKQDVLQTLRNKGYRLSLDIIVC